MTFNDRHTIAATFGTLCLAFCLGRCTLHKVPEQTPTPETLPESFSRQGEVPVPQAWWTLFNDPQLNRFVERVLQDNLDLHGAFARLQQFEALARQSGAALKPQVQASGTADRSGTGGEAGSNSSSEFSLALFASYEIDIWKKLSQRQKAARSDLESAALDLESLAQTLAATAVQTYFAHQQQAETLGLLQAQVATNRQLLEIIEMRFTQGLASAIDVYQQREQLASTEALVPSAQAGLQLLQHQMAVLAATPPQTSPAFTTHALPVPGPLPELGVPLAWMSQRPDIQSAAMRLKAADYRLGVAIADRFPSLNLSGDIGSQALQLGDLFSNWFWRVAASLVGPLLDGGARKAEIARREALVLAAAKDYEAEVLNAIREVEDALVQESFQRETLQRLQDRETLAQQALDAARERYLRGIGPFLSVLTATQAFQSTERQVIEARRRLIDYRIDLHRALGGDFGTRSILTEHVQNGIEP